MTEIQYLTGERNSLADVDGFLVGNSHDETLKSGVTVLLSAYLFITLPSESICIDCAVFPAEAKVLIGACGV